MSRIAIIEENALMRSLLMEWLTAEGYRVIAVDRTPRNTPAPADLVVVDVYMPRDAGLERLHRVRRAYPHASIIAISGQFTPGLAHTGATAETLGVDALIAKPFDRKTLLHAVQSIVGPPPPDRAADAQAQRTKRASR